ncbi:hypothetical protein DMUE_2922 [Dictyocoela muelleri]|nr:hypothetical protein DMUE_2922 [Dictyocoela muelleri]
MEYELAVKRKPIRKYDEMVIENISNFIYENNEIIGDLDEIVLPKIVEIDDILFFKKKYNRGRHNFGQWYVGGIERGKKAFKIPVNNRNTTTMLQIITENILPGTIIITNDGELMLQH